MSVINYEIIFESHPRPMWVIDTETKDLLAINQWAFNGFIDQIKLETLDKNRLPGVTISSFPLLNDGKQA